MATTIGKLIVRQVDILPEGFHSDGGSRAWVYHLLCGILNVLVP